MIQWINIFSCSTGFREVVVDHPADLSCFRHRRVAAFFVTADLVFAYRPSSANSRGNRFSTSLRLKSNGIIAVSISSAPIRAAACILRLTRVRQPHVVALVEQATAFANSIRRNSLQRFPAARLIKSLAIRLAPICSLHIRVPSCPSSMEPRRNSAIRHHTLFFSHRERRSALETADSITVIGRRCDTPECLSIRWSSRASKAICSMARE